MKNLSAAPKLPHPDKRRWKFLSLMLFQLRSCIPYDIWEVVLTLKKGPHKGSSFYKGRPCRDRPRQQRHNDAQETDTGCEADKSKGQCHPDMEVPAIAIAWQTMPIITKVSLFLGRMQWIQDSADVLLEATTKKQINRLKYLWEIVQRKSWVRHWKEKVGYRHVPNEESMPSSSF